MNPPLHQYVKSASIGSSWTFLLITFFFLLIPMHCQGIHEGEEEVINVRLSTDQPLTPLFLAKIIDEKSGLDSSYIDQLEQILLFDLSHDGRTQVIPRNRERDRLANTGNFDDLGSTEQWKNFHVHSVIKMRIQDKKISARMLSVHINSNKSINSLPLTGNLSQDRRQIHLLADMIHKTVYNVDGIASTAILYTWKYQSPQQGNNWLSEIWESDYDGNNPRMITQADSGYCITPVYVTPKPGHRAGSLFYVSYKNGQPKIFIASLKEGIGKRFSYLKASQLMPAISRQRDKVAFISDTTGNPDLFLQDFSPEIGAIGKPRQIYTTHLATQGTPCFSPEGDRIAFVSNKDGSPRIYVLKIPSPNTKLKDIQAKLLSRANSESTAPSWSPDGSKLAYCARNGGVRQIWIYDFDKDEEWQLTEGTQNKENPSWAPNSLHLIYNTVEKENGELFIINLNQRKSIKISSGLGKRHFPNWEPTYSL